MKKSILALCVFALLAVFQTAQADPPAGGCGGGGFYSYGDIVTTLEDYEDEVYLVDWECTSSGWSWVPGGIRWIG